MSIELKERLKKVLENESFADFVKEGLGKREREKKSLEEEHDVGYGEGYADGYEKARDEFIIKAPCGICGGPMFIRSVENKKRLVDFIRSERWCHPSCIDRGRRYR